MQKMTGGDGIRSFGRVPYFSSNSVSLPNCGIEGVCAVVTFSPVKIDGVDVGFSDGERYLAGPLVSEMIGSRGKQQARQSKPPVLGMNANLSHMAAPFAYTRAQRQGYEITTGPLDDHMGNLCGKGPAAGIADDVMEKAY